MLSVLELFEPRSSSSGAYFCSLSLSSKGENQFCARAVDFQVGNGRPTLQIDSRTIPRWSFLRNKSIVSFGENKLPFSTLFEWPGPYNASRNSSVVFITLSGRQLQFKKLLLWRFFCFTSIDLRGRLTWLFTISLNLEREKKLRQFLLRDKLWS